MTLRLFIYGTLKRGESRHGLLAGQELLGEAVSEPCYRLYNVGSYPALVAAEDGLAIEGELWQVDATCLAELDRVEGVDEGLYERSTVRLRPPWNETAFTYVYLLPVDGLEDCGSRW